MKVFAQYVNLSTRNTVKVEKFESKKAAAEHFESVGYRKSGNYFHGCMTNDFGGIMDVSVILYPCNAMSEEILWA